jgi:hypothetical protein
VAIATVDNKLNSEHLEHYVEETKAYEDGTSQKMAYTLS